jgi:ankyrin repeat protein
MKDPALSKAHFMPMKRLIAVDDAEAMCARLDAHPEILHLETPLGGWIHMAAHVNALNCARALIERGVNIDGHYNSQMGSALNVACSDGQMGMVELLLEAGASVEATLPEFNALFSAVHANRPDIAQRLVEAGVDVAIEYQKGWTPLRFAEEMGIAEMAVWLRRQIGWVTTPNAEG